MLSNRKSHAFAQKQFIERRLVFAFFQYKTKIEIKIQQRIRNL